ncbi:MAG: AlpA family phage regulatory protein, partial [Methylocella sp.]
MSILRYRDLQDRGIFNNRMALARALRQYNFPPPIELGSNSIGWDSADVAAWLSARPRRRP